MPPSASRPAKEPGAYHHGDLRAALIRAAREALGTSSHDAISLKSLAASLGVSQPAPYRHFGSREALLEVVAIEGFEEFRVSMGVDDQAMDGLERSCLAYLGFGRTNPGLYRLMFASRLLTTTTDETLRQASNAAFDGLLRRISTRVAPEHVRTTAVWVWSTLHGLVMLEHDALASGPSGNQVDPAQVVRRMVKTLERAGGPT